MESIRILACSIDDVTMDEALSMVSEMVAQGGAHQIVTVNPEFVIRAAGDPFFAGVLERADLAIPDGQGLLWAARFLGRRLRALRRGLRHGAATGGTQCEGRLFAIPVGRCSGRGGNRSRAPARAISRDTDRWDAPRFAAPRR